MELFDIVKTIFKSDKDWNKVSRNDKVRNFFMINRVMSIQFPAQANQFNNTKISPRPVVDWWHSTLSRYYSKTPGWIFTKTKKSKSTVTKKSNEDVKPEVEMFIMERFEVSRRELQDLKRFYPDRYAEWVSGISEQLGH